MKYEEPKPHQWYKIALVALGMIVLVVLFTITMGKLNDTISDLSEIQYLNSSTQRCVQIILRDKRDEQFVFLIGKQTEQYLNIEGSEALSVVKIPEYSGLATDVLDDWHTIYDIIQEDVVDGNVLEIATDGYFHSMTLLTTAVRDEIEDLNKTALYVQYTLLTLVLLAGCAVFNKLIQTTAALQHNKELAKLAAIDTATGLFNRSKCQELFKDTTISTDIKFSGIIVFDLNDLKKTNDEFGHRVGDELIFSFANSLKEACNVHQIKPFLGRYGGDEFIVYYRNMESEEEIKLFLKELSFVTSEFNKKENRFHISYAAGYALNNTEGDEKNIRQMFEEADESMYKNKQLSKQSLLT